METGEFRAMSWSIEGGEWMRIGMQLNYAVDFHSSLSQIPEFEREGLDFVWVAEAYELDSPTLMGYRHLARTHLKASNIHNDALYDAALGEFRRQLTYKCSWHGSGLWVTDRWYPSSKLCFLCRMKNAGLLRSAPMFRCEHCGLVTYRDLNAAKTWQL